MAKSFVLLLLFLVSYGGADNIPVQNSKAGCPPPFYNIGGRCIHFETSVTGSYSAMRIFCLEWGSDLLKLDSADYMYDLVNYINNMGLSGPNYWIGGTDEEMEGVWIYPDGSPMKMGTPFWANAYDVNEQQPNGGRNQNCAYLENAFHYFVSDSNCSFALSAVCEMAQVNPEAHYLSKNSAASCSSPFYDVSGRCLFIDNVTSGSWYDMRIYCYDLGSDILTLDSGDFMYDLVRYIHENGLSGVFYWIGGNDEDSEGHWMYPDGVMMKMGTPFWANSYDEHIQQPDGETSQNCAILDNDFHYFINDVECSHQNHVICEQRSM